MKQNRIQSPYGLDFSGSRLEKLLQHAIKRNRRIAGTSDGHVAVQEYMRVYSTELADHVHRGGDRGDLVKGKSHQDTLSPMSLSNLAGKEIEAAQIQELTISSEDLLKNLLGFAETSADLPVAAIFSDPFCDLDVTFTSAFCSRSDCDVDSIGV